MKTLILVAVLALVCIAESPKIYAEDGTYLGKLNNNKYDPESVTNPYGKYGSEYSSTSINNPYSKYSTVEKEADYSIDYNFANPDSN